MAKTFRTPIDMSKLEIRQPIGHLLASAPGSPATGQFYYNTTDNVLRFWDGTAWIDMKGGSPTGAAGGDLSGTYPNPQIAAGVIVNADVNASAAIALSKLATDPLARANHTGTQTASTVSDFDTQVRISRLDQMAAPTASVSLNSQKITNLLDPTAAQDAASKAYVDAVKTGLDVKDSVRVATAAALPANTRSGNVLTASANGALTVDGVTVDNGERVLVKDEGTGANNGLFVITDKGAAGAPFILTRSTDADATAEVSSGLFVFASEGTANADSGWVLTTNDPITLNTTALAFTQFSGAGQITAGAALTKTGNTLDVATDGSTLEVSADALRVKAGGVLESHLADNSVGLDDSQGTVYGTLALGNGGTGQTTAKAARETGLGGAGYYSTATHSAGTTITITQATHGLRSSRGLIVQVQNESDGAEEEADVAVAANGDVVVTFAASQSADTKRVTLCG